MTTAEVDVADYAKALVATQPPLSEAQRERIAAVLTRRTLAGSRAAAALRR